MGNIIKGVVAGLVATVVLSILMLAKTMMGVMPELDVISMLSGMMGVAAPIAWVIHFMVGAVWGALFAVLYGTIPGNGTVIKGMVFGTVAWLLMMLMVMPMASAGMFGMKFGMVAPAMTWMLHLVFGAVLGMVYARNPGPVAEAG